MCRFQQQEAAHEACILTVPVNSLPPLPSGWVPAQQPGVARRRWAAASCQNSPQTPDRRYPMNIAVAIRNWMTPTAAWRTTYQVGSLVDR